MPCAGTGRHMHSVDSSMSPLIPLVTTESLSFFGLKPEDYSVAGLEMRREILTIGTTTDFTWRFRILLYEYHRLTHHY